LFSSMGKEIACLIVEPIAGNMGVVPPQPGFLEVLRKVTSQSGALLIFDEVITGFRVSFGGAQKLYGVSPDLTCLGKIIGGGLPVGAYGGKKEMFLDSTFRSLISRFSFSRFSWVSRINGSCPSNFSVSTCMRSSRLRSSSLSRA